VNHTVSFEMAKRLKEAGWPQRESATSIFPMYDSNQSLITRFTAHPLHPPFYSAPILTELLEALRNVHIEGQEGIEYTTSMSLLAWDGNPCDTVAKWWLWCK